MARMAVREVERARQSLAAADAVLQEAVRRGGPALAMVQGDGVASVGDRTEQAAAVTGRHGSSTAGRKEAARARGM